ncbi:Uncharacterised protein [Mycobacterium tuberculosis]|nr:Uncharacterised protein [Mycobacterium tuberculosis]
MPSAALTRLPVKSVSVMTTRLAPGPAGVSDSDSRSTTRCAVPVPGATSAAYPPVAMWARSIAKISSMSRWCPRADGAARTSNSIADSSDNWLNVHHG